ncbi:MAG: YIP1 family protein [Pseudomonadota bacterium]
MKIICPFCNFSRDVDPDKLPANVKRATCPKCRQKFDLNLDSVPLRPESPTPRPIATPPAAAPASREKYRPMVDRESENLGEWKAASSTSAAFSDEDAGEERGGVPWEERPDGFFGDMWATAKMAMFSPSRFFESMPISGGTKAPLGFGILTGTLGTLFALTYQALFTILGLGIGGGFGMSEMGFSAETPLAFMLMGLVAAVVFTPLAILIGLYIGSAIAHLFLVIVRGGGGGFQATFRVMAYSSSCQLLNAIPLLGSFLGGLWGMVVAVIGLARAHEVGVGRVILGLFVLPLVLVILFGVGIAFLVGGLPF